MLFHLSLYKTAMVLSVSNETVVWITSSARKEGQGCLEPQDPDNSQIRMPLGGFYEPANEIGARPLHTLPLSRMPHKKLPRFEWEKLPRAFNN
jgi:hypothetical protein